MKREIHNIFKENRPTPFKYPPILEVYDDFIPSLIADKLENLIYQTPFFYQKNITHNLSSSSNKDIAFSKRLFDNLDQYVSSSLFSFLEPLYFFLIQKNIVIDTISQARVFLQPPSLNPEILDIHIDQFNPHMVFLYYINDSEGDTYFYNHEGEVIKQVSPKKGRFMWFDGSYYHCGSKPESNTRAILNINLTVK